MLPDGFFPIDAPVDVSSADSHSSPADSPGSISVHVNTSPSPTPGKHASTPTLVGSDDGGSGDSTQPHEHPIEVDSDDVSHHHIDDDSEPIVSNGPAAESCVQPLPGLFANATVVD